MEGKCECCNEKLIPQTQAIIGIARQPEAELRLKSVNNFLYRFYACAVCVFPEETCLFERMLRDNAAALEGIAQQPEAAGKIERQIYEYFIIMLQQLLCKYKCDDRICDLLKCFFSATLALGSIPLGEQSIYLILYQIIQISVLFRLPSEIYCVIYKIIYNLLILGELRPPEFSIRLGQDLSHLEKYKELQNVLKQIKLTDL